MEVIASLEPWRRSAYTGVFGYVGRQGALELAMAIRTIEVAKVGPEQPACYFAGGGIAVSYTHLTFAQCLESRLLRPSARRHSPQQRPSRC